MKTKLLKIGRKFLPKIFLKKAYLDGKVIYLPRWGFTKKEIFEAEKEAKILSDRIFLNENKNRSDSEGK